MARFYADEDFPLQVVELLRGLGHDILIARDAGNANLKIPDEDVIAFAVNQERTVLTRNRRDFIRLHMLQPEHMGIVVCTNDQDFVRLANRIHEAISQYEHLSGQLIRVNRPPQ